MAANRSHLLGWPLHRGIGWRDCVGPAYRELLRAGRMHAMCRRSGLTSRAPGSNPVGIDGTRCIQMVEREPRVPRPDNSCMELRTSGAQSGRNVKQKASDGQPAR